MTINETTAVSATKTTSLNRLMTSITSDKIMDIIDKNNYRISTDPVKENKDNYDEMALRQQGLAIPMHPVSSVEVAELTKIVENAHRYLQIAFAEELYLYCKSNGISFSELRESLNTKWNVEVLEPRDGIGGHCLPKDTKMFINSSNTIKSKILQAAMEIDEEYKKFVRNNRIR